MHAVAALSAAAEKSEPLRFDTLVRQYGKPEHLVPAYEAVVTRMEEDGLWRLITFCRVRVVRNTNVLKHLNLKLHEI